MLLLEAGEAYRPNLYPPDLADADVTGGPDGHDWGYTGVMIAEHLAHRAFAPADPHHAPRHTPDTTR